jgi:ParB/RepB/Spo0J family partition protein
MGKNTTALRGPSLSGGKPSNKAQSTPPCIVKKIHPRMLADSPWSSRHESAYDSNAYITLKKDLKAHKVNQIPVLARPNPEYNRWSKANGTPKWQLVYGGMRHAACLELDIKMNVFVQELTDAQAFVKAHSENALRSQLSVFERGLFYCSALKSGLFGSMRGLAAHLKVSVSEVSRATFLAKLPNEVLQTMTSPAD